jgi:hypothetical protein
MRTDGHTDMIKLRVVFRNFAKASKNLNICVKKLLYQPNVLWCNLQSYDEHGKQSVADAMHLALTYHLHSMSQYKIPISSNWTQMDIPHQRRTRSRCATVLTYCSSTKLTCSVVQFGTCNIKCQNPFRAFLIDLLHTRMETQTVLYAFSVITEDIRTCNKETGPIKCRIKCLQKFSVQKKWKGDKAMRDWN